LWPLFPLAHAAETVAQLTGKEPFVTVAGLKMAKNRMFFSAAKAARELGYRPTPHLAALRTALDWFSGEGYLK
jgi:dihydroflavonol-4-reductase